MPLSDKLYTAWSVRLCNGASMQVYHLIYDGACTSTEYDLSPDNFKVKHLIES